MGTTKTEQFTERQNGMATLLKAIGHPARVAIIEHLLKVNECICGDIVSELPLAQATISQHLKELKKAGLIKGNTEGTAICYCIDEKAVDILAAYFGNMAQNLACRGNDCC